MLFSTIVRWELFRLTERRKAEPASGRRLARRHPLALLLTTSAGLALASQTLGRAR
jgi:hypothetical protein